MWHKQYIRYKHYVITKCTLQTAQTEFEVYQKSKKTGIFIWVTILQGYFARVFCMDILQEYFARIFCMDILQGDFTTNTSAFD
jgi:hypothetical protein